MKIKTEDIQNLVETQITGGEENVDLCQENAQSPMVRSIESNDFMGRYAEDIPIRIRKTDVIMKELD